MKAFKYLIGVGLASACLAHGDTVSNIYTVVVNEGTLDTPVSIETTTVEIGSTAGGETTTLPFSDVSFAANAIFRKRGTGYMLSSLKMQNFTGELRIEEGAFVVNTNNQMGVTTTTTGAPRITVCAGASLVIDTSEATVPQKKMRVYNTLYLAGEGADGNGALCMRNRNTLADQLFYGPWHLQADTLIINYFNQRWDLSSITIYHHGHNLVYRRAAGASKQALMGPCGSTFDNTDAGAKPVTFTVDKDGLQLQGKLKLKGTAADRLIFTNGCGHTIYSFSIDSDWTLVNAGYSSFYCSYAKFTYPNVESGTYWKGPIVLQKGDMVFSTITTNQGIRFLSPISGTGSFYSTGNLGFASTNTFTGSIGVNCTRPQVQHGVVFKGRYSVSPNLTSLALTNASTLLTFANTLDKVDFINNGLTIPYISLQTTTACADAEMEGIVSNVAVTALEKTGAGNFALSTPLTATNDWDIKEGTMKLACASAGLIGGRCYAANKTDYYTPGGVHWTSDNGCAHDTKETWTNIVQLTPGVNVSSADVLDQLWPGEKLLYGQLSGKDNQLLTRLILMYNGYIWNRATTNVTWSFGGSFGTHTTIWIDGTQLYQYTHYQTWLGKTVTLTPGPHSIRLTTYGNAGEIGPNGTAFTNAVWKTANNTGAGVRYDPLGRGSRNYTDYLELKDPGDGSLLTVSTNGTAAWRPDYAAGTLRVAKGAMLDLFGSAFKAEALMGFGVITNSNPYVTGSVHVQKELKVTAADVRAVTGPMKVHVPLKFAAGAKVVCTDLASFPHSAELLVLLEADQPIEGLANLSFDRVPNTPSRKWRLEAGTDGKSVRFAYACGTTLIFR